MPSPEYFPRYAPGQVLVKLKDELDTEEFAKGFGVMLGYELIRKHEDRFLYRVPEGKEDAGIRCFRRQQRVVESAERFDLKLEERCAFVESIGSDLQDLYVSEDPDRTFNAALRKIANSITKYVKKNS